MSMSLAAWKSATENRATIENPSVSLSDPNALESIWGVRDTDAGIRMTPKTAMSYAAVWQAVSMISGRIAQLPLNVYRRGPDDSREVDRTHPASAIVRRRFNRLPTSSFRGWREAMVHACLWNNAYLWIDRAQGDGRPVALYNLLPNATKPEFVDGRLIYRTIGYDGQMKQVPRDLPAEDVIHISGPHIRQDEPLELIELARTSWGTGIQAERFTAKFFASGIKSGGILIVPPGASEKYVDNLEGSLQEGYSRDNKWFKTIVLRDGAKLEKWSMSPEEAEMQPTREEQIRQVARYFNLQPSRLGMADSSSYNSKSEDNRQFLEDTLSPWLEAIVSECDLKLLSREEEESDSHYFQHDTSNLLRMDFKTRVQVGVMGVKGGLFSPNEWRKGEGLPARDGGDDYATIGKQADMSGMQKGENDQPRGPASDDIEGDGVADDARAIRRAVFAICESARRKSNDRQKFASWAKTSLRQSVNQLQCSDKLKEWLQLRVSDCSNVVGSDFAAIVDAATEEIESIITGDVTNAD